MKKIYIFIGIAVLLLIAVVFYFKLSQDKTAITLPITPRGDFIDPGPIEDECQRRMDQYIQGAEFSNKGFSKCDLVESRVGFDAKECPNGFSPTGCSICKLECE